MECSKRKSITEDLNKFTCAKKEGSYISICEWENGEGWDFDIDGKLFQLSCDELDAINYLTSCIRYDFDEK